MYGSVRALGGPGGSEPQLFKPPLDSSRLKLRETLAKVGSAFPYGVLFEDYIFGKFVFFPPIIEFACFPQMCGNFWKRTVGSHAQSLDTSELVPIMFATRIM